MPKAIQLQSGDDITAIVGYLWECEDEEVFFNVPADSSFLQNAIALKLLMRETNRLGKDVVFITRDALGRQAAQRVGFEARATLPPGAEVVNKSLLATKAPYAPQGEAAEAKEAGETLRDVPAQKYESMIANEVALKRQALQQSSGQARKRFSDISPRIDKSEAVEETDRAFHAETMEAGVADGDAEIAPPRGDLDVVWPYEPAVERVENKKGDITREQGEEKFLIKEMGREVPAGRIDDKKLSRWQEKFSLKRFAADKREFEEEKQEATGDRVFSFKFLSAFIGAGLLVGALALFLILPKVEISIQPKTEMVAGELKVIVDKAVLKIDEAGSKIPGQTLRLEKEATREFAATAKKELNEKAKGAITVYNEFSSQAQTLVATTRFVSKGNIVFRLTKTIVVPGVKVEDGQTIPGSINVDVVADQAGGQGNIAAGRFTIPGFLGSPKFEKFYGVSQTAMTGGARDEAVVVSQADFDNGKKELWDELQADLAREIQSQVPAGLKLLSGAMKQEIAQAASSAAPGDKVSKFSLTIKGSASALLFDENDLSALAQKKDEGPQNANKKLTAEREISYDSLQADFAKGQLSFKAKISQKLVWVIDAAKIKNLVVGRNAEEIKEIFAQRQEISKAKVSFWPFWVSRAPDDFNKIKVTVEQ